MRCADVGLEVDSDSHLVEFDGAGTIFLGDDFGHPVVQIVANRPAPVGHEDALWCFGQALHQFAACRGSIGTYRPEPFRLTGPCLLVGTGLPSSGGLRSKWPALPTYLTMSQ